MTTERTALGKRIRQARRQADLTLGDVSRALGVSISFLSDIETGRRHPSSTAFVVHLASILMVEAGPLVELYAHERGGVRIASSNNKVMQVAASLARHQEDLDPETLATILELIEKGQTK